MAFVYCEYVNICFDIEQNTRDPVIIQELTKNMQNKREIQTIWLQETEEQIKV